jgi:hypothetical protein
MRLDQSGPSIRSVIGVLEMRIAKAQHRFRILIAAVLALSTVSVTFFAANAQPPKTVLRYYNWTPLVAVAGTSASYTLTALIEGNRTSAELVTATGPVFPLERVAKDTYELTLNSSQVLDGYLEGDAHNFVGYLDIYDGASRIFRINIFMNVRDSTMPDIALSQLAEDVQAGPHIINIRRDALWISGYAPEDAVVRFYEFFEDDVDFIAVVSQVRTVRNRLYWHVRNYISGLGLSFIDRGSSYGSENRLQGVINFPIDSFFDLATHGSLHEIGHRWMCYLANPELDVFGYHWPISNVAYGIMGFSISGSGAGGTFSYELVELPNGEYGVTRVEPATQFNSLELYLMGLITENEVEDAIVFQNQDEISAGGTIQGPVDVLTIDDIVAVNGPRSPGVGSAQTNFRIASIVLSAGRLLTPDEMAFFDHMSARAEATSELRFTEGFSSGTTKPFFLATGGRATLTTVPEPKGWLMLVAGTAFLGLLYRRRTRELRLG